MSDLFELAKSIANVSVQGYDAGRLEGAAERDRLWKENAKLRRALEEIEDLAQDRYDGPEDRINGPYLALAQEGLGKSP
jgi:hypothetical protein